MNDAHLKTIDIGRFVFFIKFEYINNMLETNGKSYLGSVFKLTQAKHPISVCVRLKLVNPFIIKDDCVITDISIACPPDREHILFEVVLSIIFNLE